MFSSINISLHVRSRVGRKNQATPFGRRNGGKEKSRAKVEPVNDCFSPTVENERNIARYVGTRKSRAVASRFFPSLPFFRHAMISDIRRRQVNVEKASKIAKIAFYRDLSRFSRFRVHRWIRGNIDFVREVGNLRLGGL